jgi:hypothetical protein
MSFKLVLCAMLVLSGDLFAREPVPHPVWHEMTNIWEYINYPFPTNSPTTTFFSVSSGAMWGPDQLSLGLSLDIFNIVQGFPFFKTNAITAVLYRADGEMVEPTAEGRKLLNAPVAISTVSIPGEMPNPQVMTYFPWGSNVLEESWIKITIASERYWLEIPYGFDFCPTNPPAPANTNGPPKFVPMKVLTGHDHIVRWESVHYNLGQTTNGWELSLIQSNPLDAKSDVDLYDFPKTQNVYSSHTGVSVVDANNAPVTGHCVNIHLDDNYLRRTDTSDLITRDADDLRCWGQIEISVDGKTNCITVPSSLYKYTHGHVRP